MSAIKLFAEASSNVSSEDNNSSSDDLTGGVLNYRTGKLDDGTDPNGWYEKD
ncbi:hypothetical protein N9J88_06390 [Porticoccaceae bacterium]|nr:hypothetical protein [Porticoccaceae bacterium]